MMIETTGEIQEWLLGNAERIDNEFGCCHSISEIALMVAGGTGSACLGVDVYLEGLQALTASLRASDPYVTDLIGDCLHGGMCDCPRWTDGT